MFSWDTDISFLPLVVFILSRHNNTLSPPTLYDYIGKLAAESFCPDKATITSMQQTTASRERENI